MPHSAGVNVFVVALYVGQLPDDCVNRFMYEPFVADSCAARVGAVSSNGVPPCLNVSRQKSSIWDANVGRLR